MRRTCFERLRLRATIVPSSLASPIARSTVQPGRRTIERTLQTHAARAAGHRAEHKLQQTTHRRTALSPACPATRAPPRACAAISVRVSLAGGWQWTSTTAARTGALRWNATRVAAPLGPPSSPRSTNRMLKHGAERRCTNATNNAVCKWNARWKRDAVVDLDPPMGAAKGASVRHRSPAAICVVAVVRRCTQCSFPNDFVTAAYVGGCGQLLGARVGRFPR